MHVVRPASLSSLYVHLCISALLILNLLYLNFPHIDRICEILSPGIIERLHFYFLQTQGSRIAKTKFNDNSSSERARFNAHLFSVN